MTSEQLKRWRDHLRFSQKQAAAALGLHHTTYAKYEAFYPDEIVPQKIALACAAIVSKARPYKSKRKTPSDLLIDLIEGYGLREVLMIIAEICEALATMPDKDTVQWAKTAAIIKRAAYKIVER